MAVGEANAKTQSATDRWNARLYLTGLGCSVIGSMALSLVAGIWVKSLTGSSAQAGIASACVYLPSLFGPLAGMIADRAARRRLLVRLSVVSAVADLPLLLVRSAAWTWVIFCVMAWYGMQLVLSGPAEDALFTEMFPQDLRQRVNGLRLGLQESGRLVAPLVGAGLFALAGGGVVALVDAATFVVAATATARLRVRDEAPARPEKLSWRAGVLAGYAHIRRTPALARVMSAGAVVLAVSGVLVAAQYSLVQATGKPPAFLGVFEACLGGGSIVASLVSSRLLRLVGEGWLSVFGTVDFAVGNALRATGVLGWALAGTVVLGFALPWVFLAVVNLAQRVTPIHLQGRVSAAVTLAMFGPQAPLQALGSLAILYGTFRQLYAGAAIVALACAAYLAPRARTARTACPSPRPEHPPVPSRVA
ncbi:MAG TPA: MFS transporter [Streptosporangiaceae bacterium]|nr:MFS transporter [Streptosporangiaceae bacterium]